MPKSSTPALFPTVVRPWSSLSTSAWLRCSGIPHGPEPPAAMVIPSFSKPCSAEEASAWTLLIADPFIGSDGVGGFHQRPPGKLHGQVALGNLRAVHRAADELGLLPAGRRQLGGLVPGRAEQRQPLH